MTVPPLRECWLRKLPDKAEAISHEYRGGGANLALLPPSWGTRTPRLATVGACKPADPRIVRNSTNRMERSDLRPVTVDGGQNALRTQGR
jgi:hypothetical protein